MNGMNSSSSDGIPPSIPLAQVHRLASTAYVCRNPSLCSTMFCGPFVVVFVFLPFAFSSSSGRLRGRLRLKIRSSGSFGSASRDIVIYLRERANQWADWFSTDSFTAFGGIMRAVLPCLQKKRLFPIVRRVVSPKIKKGKGVESTQSCCK